MTTNLGAAGSNPARCAIPLANSDSGLRESRTRTTLRSPWAASVLNQTGKAGHAGIDTLNGLGGGDTPSGAGGNDTLVGGVGKDDLTGGSWADQFVFASTSDSTNAHQDVINDFTHGQHDLIDLSAIDGKTGGGDNAFSIVSEFTGEKGPADHNRTWHQRVSGQW